MATAENSEDDVRAIRTRIRYLGEGPMVTRRYVSAGVEHSTGRYEDHDVVIRDGRNIRERIGLDSHAFALIDTPTAVADFHDKAWVDAIYPDECAASVRRVTGADCVLPQGWMIRTSADIPKTVKKVAGYQHQGGVQPPAGEAHVDYSPDTAPRTAERIYRRDYPDGQGYSRFIAFSFWRAFSPPPQDWPLALCDGRSIAGDEGVRNALHVVDEMPPLADMERPIPGEDEMIAASVFRYRAAHRWWYFSNMAPDEAVLIKFHDSDHSVAWRCMHTAFFDDSLPNARTRESIEVRLIAYFR